MGYSKEQIKELQTTINNADADLIIDGTPVNLGKVIEANKPIIAVDYILEEKGHPTIKMC